MSEASKLLPAERLAAIRRRIFPWLPQLFEYKVRRAGYRASNQDMLALVDIRDLLIHAEAQAERIAALEAACRAVVTAGETSPVQWIAEIGAAIERCRKALEAT